MPIIIKNYTWSETENHVNIKVPLNNVHPSKVDLFTSKRYIKASFEQYFFEVLLLNEIVLEDSKCTKTDSHIEFNLKKSENNYWNLLEADIPKSERNKLKIECIENEHQRIQTEHENNKMKKSELKKVAVREQIELDTKNRNLIEAIKQEEKNNALGDINQWSSGITKSHKHSYKKKELCCKPVKTTTPIPDLRATQSLHIDFTPRQFPTPSRESRLDEENEWLKKQAEARRSSGFISADIRPEERNPQFLKAKGDEFLRNKNYIGAISAYSFGLKLSDKFVDFYIARSEAHLAIGNLNKTVNDCSTALDLLKPELPINIKERALCIGRRGVALCELGLLREGISEIEASLKLVPNANFETSLQNYKSVN